LLEPAERELDDAVTYCNAQASGLGDAFLLELLRAIDLISPYPDAWHPLGSDTRRCRLRRFPYAVIYAREPEGLLIVAVAHLHRRPGYWRERLGPKS
jgi:hypothetical protein